MKIVLPIGIGVYLTWYFLSGLTKEEVQQTKDSFVDANYFWVILSLILMFLSHLSRAYRWKFLLEPLGYKPKLSNAYHAVMAGYVINYTVPRSGEFARAGLLTNYEKVPFEKGFATIVVERVIDVIMLAIVFFFTGYLQTNTDQFDQITNDPNSGGSSNTIWYILGGGALLVIIGLIVYLKSPKIKKLINDKIRGFWEGLKSVWTMKKKWAFIGHTLFIWGCYVGTMWVSAQAFPETKDMPIGCVFGAFVVGAAAIAAVPGGLGLYPLWISQVMELYSIQLPALAISVGVTQTGLIVVLGLLCLFLIQRQPKLMEVQKDK